MHYALTKLYAHLKNLNMLENAIYISETLLKALRLSPFLLYLKFVLYSRYTYNFSH